MNKTKYKSKLLIALLIFSQIGIGNAAMYGKGYTIVDNQYTTSADLQQIIQKYINANNIQEGINILLEGTGWRLASNFAGDPQLHRLLNSPWAKQWKLLGPDHLINILNQIGGKGWTLVIDPVNRLISYEVRDIYKK